MALLSAITLAIAIGQAKAAPPSAKPLTTKDWQARYEKFVRLMKKKDVAGVVAHFHRDYTVTVDGVVSVLAAVKKRLPTDMDAMSKFGQTPKVLSSKQVGNTATVLVEMRFKNSRKEQGKTAVYLGQTKIRDTWLKVGSRFQIYRSTHLSSSMTRNGKPFDPSRKPGGKTQ